VQIDPNGESADRSGLDGFVARSPRARLRSLWWLRDLGCPARNPIVPAASIRASALAERLRANVGFWARGAHFWKRQGSFRGFPIALDRQVFARLGSVPVPITALRATFADAEVDLTSSKVQLPPERSRGE
jgi:hypothetical protein